MARRPPHLEGGWTRLAMPLRRVEGPNGGGSAMKAVFTLFKNADQAVPAEEARI